MNIYSIPKGIKVNNSKFIYPLSATMVAVARYRRFILLLIICCVSFFVFGWYTRIEENGTWNDSQLTERVENPDTDFGVMDTPDAYLMEESETSKEEFLTSSENKVKNHFGESVNQENDWNDLHLKEDRFRPPVDDLDLFSGPTEELVTFRSRRLPNVRHFNEDRFRHPVHDLDLFSGPPIESVTIPSKRHEDFESQFSGPLEPNSEIFPKLPMRYRHIEMENSALPEFIDLKPTKPTKVVEKANNIRSKYDYTTKEKYSKLTLKSTTSANNVTNPVKNPGLILDTPGCKIPQLDPWDPTIIDLYEKLPPLECPGPPSFMKAQPDGSISISETILKNHYNLTLKKISCFYQAIYRKHEEPGNFRENDYYVGNVTDMKFGVPLNEDYVGVLCYMGKKRSRNYKEFHQYFPLVRLKPEVEEERSSIPPPEHKLNIILAGVDSISKLNFLRHFPRTHAFLKEKMTPFDMLGYTKVGDNTFPNLVPLLTGHFVEHYWNESLMDTMFFDHLDLIWKDYAKKGYRTFFAEDAPWSGTFQYLKRGFYDPPTDYYLRPLALAVEQLKFNLNYTEHCLNSQIETDLVYDYLRDFIQAMGPRPHFAFAMVSTITHDILNKAGWADEPTVHLLESLHDSGALNNSMLVLFSDHGLRFGEIRERYIGKFEERMPFMFVHFPNWFLEQYPQIAKNLQDNQERLITLFDVHATMIDLLDLKAKRTPEEWRSVTRGSSLLKEISPYRTCEEASIRAHWCPCQTFEEVALNDIVAINCAQAIVDDINLKLEPYNSSCAVLEIDKISDARLGQANDLVLRFVRDDPVVVNHTVIYGHSVIYGDIVDTLGDYLITLRTKPGGAIFEGTVRHDSENDFYSVLGISRINMYGNQSWCIDSQKMKIFCYCTT